MAGEDVVAKVGADSSELKAELRSVKELLLDFGKQASEPLEVQKAEQYRERLASIGDVAGQIGEKFSAVAKHFLDQADAVDALGDKLSATFDESQVGPFVDAIRELGATPPFTGEQFAGALQDLAKFNVEGLATVENLTRIGDVAAKTGGDIGGLSQVWGLLARGGDEAKRAVQALSKEYGISGAELAKFGAKVDESGQLLVKTPAQAEAARKALEALADSEKFAGSMDKMAGGLEKFQGQLQLVSQDAGKPILEFLDGLAGSAAEVLKNLRDTNPELAGFVGGTSAVVGGLGSVAGGAIETGAQIGLLATGFPAMKAAAVGAAGAAKTAFTAVAGAIGMVPIALAAAAIGLALYTAELEKANKAAEDLLAIEERRAAGLREHKNLIGKSADEMKRLGVTAADVTQVIEGLQEARAQAAAEGNEDRVKELEDEIRRLRDIKSEFAALEAGQKQSAEARAQAEEQAAEQSVEAWENFKKRASAGWYETAQEQLKAFDIAASGLKRGTKEYQEAQLERVQLARKAAEEQKKASEESAAGSLKADLHRIDVAVASGNMGKAAQIAALQEILRTHQVTADERMRLEKQIAGLQKSAADEAAKAAEDAAKRATEKRLAQIELERAKMGAARDLTVADEIKLQEKVVRAHKAGTTERMKEEAKLYELRAKAREQDEESARKLQELATGLKEAQVAEVEDAIRAAEEEKAAAEAAGKSGAEAQAKIVALLEQKKALLLDIADAEAKARIDAEKDPAVRAKMAELEAKKKADVERDAAHEVKAAEKERLDILKQQTGEAQKQADAMRDTATSAKDAASSSPWANGPAMSDNPNFGGRSTPSVGFGQNQGWSINGSAAPSGMTDAEKHETGDQARERAKKTHAANAQFKVEVEQRQVVDAINNLPSAIASAIGNAVASAVRSSGGTPTQRAASAGRSFQESNMKSGGGT